MAKLYNRAKMKTETRGQGTLTLGSASSSFQSFEAAGAQDGDVVSYLIEEGSAWEYGTGTYSSSGPSLSRTLGASSTGSLLNLLGVATVSIVPLAADFIGNGSNNTLGVLNGGTGATTASAARSNLGIAIGSNVQAWDADLDAISSLSGADGLLRKRDGNTWLLDTNAYHDWPLGYEMIAHRGFLGLAPENTMTAFALAYQMGARHLETDIQISSDGVPVLIHDATVDRTTDGTGNVKDLTLAQLQALDAGSAFSARFASTQIPKFEDLVKFAVVRGVKLHPEIKGYRNQSDIDLMLSVITANNAVNLVTLYSFNISDLQYVRTKNKDIAVSLLAGDISALSSVVALGGKKGFSLLYSTLLSYPEWVTTCADNGIDLSTWTVDTHENAVALMNIGVTRIMSNYFLGVTK